MSANIIDLVLLLFFVTIIGFGFFGGVIRLLMVLISLYLSVIVGGFFYLPVAMAISTSLSAIAPYTAQLLSFILLTLLGTSALTVTLAKTFVSLRLPQSIASLDQIGGATVGVIVAMFSGVVFSIILRVYFSLVLTTANAGLQVSPFLLMLALQMQTSLVARLLVDLSAPIFSLIRLWFPTGLPAILNLG